MALSPAEHEDLYWQLDALESALGMLLLSYTPNYDHGTDVRSNLADFLRRLEDAAPLLQKLKDDPGR